MLEYPKDILALIIDELSPQSICSIMQTCKMLYILANHIYDNKHIICYTRDKTIYVIDTFYAPYYLKTYSRLTLRELSFIHKYPQFCSNELYLTMNMKGGSTVCCCYPYVRSHTTLYQKVKYAQIIIFKSTIPESLGYSIFDFRGNGARISPICVTKVVGPGEPMPFLANIVSVLSFMTPIDQNGGYLNISAFIGGEWAVDAD